MRAEEKIKSRLTAAIGIFALGLSFLGLVLLLEHVFSSGWSGLSLDFLQRGPSRKPELSGIMPALWGTIWLMLLTVVVSVPLGILTAIYLEEFAARNKFTYLIRINIANLSGVPSIVYGMLGLALFVRALSLGQSLLSGALTMSLLILPIIIMATSEALKAVPGSIREAAFGVGATRRQVVFHHVLPEAMPGALTGIILAMSRAAGETAPILLAGAVIFTAFAPEGPLDEFTALSVQIFNWASRPQAAFHHVAASAIIVLLAVTLGLNAIAIIMRARISSRRSRQ